MTTTYQLRLHAEQRAYELWFKEFGANNMSCEAERVHISKLLRKVMDKIKKTYEPKTSHPVS